MPTEEDRAVLTEVKMEEFKKGGTRRFMEVLKGELTDLPMDVYVNIKGKQKAMAENADKITNLLREIIANPQAFSQIPGVGKVFNELLEESGLSPIDFSKIVNAPAPVAPAQPLPTPEQAQPVTA